MLILNIYYILKVGRLWKLKEYINIFRAKIFDDFYWVDHSTTPCSFVKSERVNLFVIDPFHRKTTCFMINIKHKHIAIFLNQA